MLSKETIQEAKQQLRLIEAELTDESPQVTKLLAWCRLLLAHWPGENRGEKVEEDARSRVSQETMDVLERVASILKDRELPVPTATIWEILRDKEKVQVNGKDPINTLSAMLSHYSEYFEKVGRQGWVRKKESPPNINGRQV